MSKAVLINPGDVVISQMGTPGKVGVNLTDFVVVNSGNLIKCSVQSPHVCTKYLYHWLRNSEPLMKSLIRGGVIPRINLEDLKKVAKNVIYIKKITKNTKTANHPSLKFFK